MEGVTGAVWVGMQSPEHAFKNNQRLEIKSRQRSTAQHISSLIHRPAAAQSITEQNTLPTSTAQHITGFFSRAKPGQSQPKRPPQPPRRVSPKNECIHSFPGQQCQHRQNEMVYGSLIWVTAIEPQKPDCTTSHTVQITQKALGPLPKTSQNSLLPKGLWVTLVRNAQAADKPTEKHLDNGRV